MTGNGQDQLPGSAATERRSDECPHRCGYRYPIAACVRLHLIQHHNYGYDEAQEAYPDAE